MSPNASFRPNGNDGHEARVVRVEKRMDELEEQARKSDGMLDDLLKAVGKAADGGVPATGLYHLVNELGARLSVYDKAKERAIGAVSVALPMLSLIGTWVWWQYGDVIEKALKG